MRVPPSEPTPFNEAGVLVQAPFLVEQDVVALGVFTRTSLRVLAIRKPGREHYTIKPAPETKLDPGTILIVTGPAADITKLVALAGNWA